MSEIVPKSPNEPVLASGNRTIVVAQTKSVGVSLLLTFLFGPLGVVYSSIHTNLLKAVGHSGAVM
jgi:hypothetical protein